MKKILALCFLLLTAQIAQAQGNNVTAGLNTASTDCSTSTSCIQLTLGGMDSTGVIQLSGTFVGTIQFEASSNGGASWGAINGTPWNSSTMTSSATATGGWSFPVAGKTNLRVRVSAYTSGTIVASVGTSLAQSAAGATATIDSTGLATGVAQGSTTSGEVGTLVQGAVTTSAPTYTNAQTSPLSLDTTGALRVNITAGAAAGGTSSNFGSAIPSAGTAAGFTDGTNMQPALVDASKRQVVAGGGTAGTAAGGVLTVQGVASMTKLLVTPDSVALPANQSVNVAQINGTTPLMGNGASGTGAQRVTIANDSTGTIIATQATGSNLHVVTDATSTTVVTSGTASNLKAQVVGAGSAGSADAGVVTVQGIASMTPLLATLSGTNNINNISGTISLPTGAATEASLTKLPLAQASTTSGQSGPLVQGAVTTSAPTYTTAQTSPLSLSTTGALRTIVGAGSSLIGEVSPVTTATTTDTALTSYLTSAATTNSTNVKASPGNVYMIRAINTTATLYYLRMYNLASAPTCSSATGFIETIPLPASTSGAGIVSPQVFGQAYTTGIGFCITAEGTSTGNTAAATGIFVTILFK